MAVLDTTHYMEEAERLCDRVGISDEGTIKAEGTRRSLVAMIGEKDRIVLSGDVEPAADELRKMDGVVDVYPGDHRLDVMVTQASSILPALLTRITEAGGSVSGVEIEEPNLEAVLLHLTGKALRD